MKVGKYQITPAAAINPATGKFHGSVYRTWDEGKERVTQQSHFEEGFDTVNEAKQHAVDQAVLRVENGDW